MFSFKEIGCLTVRSGECEGEGEHLEGGGDVARVLGRGLTHVIADGERFFPRELHEGGNHIDALFTVTVGHRVVKLEGVDALPDAFLVLHVAEALLIHADLTKVVKQRNHRNALVGIAHM